MSELVGVVVRAGDCPCPGRPHLTETVFLEPEATIPMASAAMWALTNAETPAERMSALVAAYLPLGIRAWTFLEHDETGRLLPAPIDRESMERYVPWDKGGYELVRKADELYSARVTAPLVQTRPNRSAGGQEDNLTSQTPPLSPDTPASSRPSLRNGSDGRRSVAPAR